MKKARDAKPIKTIPDGVYESGLIHHELHENKGNRLNDMTTDAQGNGYPVPEHHEGAGN